MTTFAYRNTFYLFCGSEGLHSIFMPALGGVLGKKLKSFPTERQFSSDFSEVIMSDRILRYFSSK